MSGSLDMSLDEIIRNKRRPEGHYRNKPRISGPGPDRRGPIRDQIRTTPYPVPPAMPMQVEVPPSQGQLVPSGGPNVESKLYISNLDYGVSNEDIKVLFSEVGDLKRYSINYDMNGRSKGTAEVVFFRQTDALAAIKRYNNLQLDGKPMTIELVGANVVISAPIPPTRSSILRTPNVAPRRVERGWIRGVVNGPYLGGASHGFTRGRGHGGPIGKKLSAEDLDADLDEYHLEARRMK
ncbi:THO complex subunit 4D [Hibiscus syriacus]|uniref:THO complex subunit 4D n=1 Tax=Hibiscus syriacus TaxID=106335 RepID=A0A6A2YD30_HIBSY|nr:THO complex subunit 4B-like [Hibiscus syriacus]KAE8669864.1 THO complex subunit 4D [Hibiscus syriacus]